MKRNIIQNNNLKKNIESQISDRMISVVIVTYNSSKYIGKLISNIGKEYKQVKEIIIIENHSPDRKITRELVHKINRNSLNSIKLKFVNSNTNLGFGKACNKGVSLSSGKYVLFLNPDTSLLNNSIKTLLYHAIKSNAQISGGKMVHISGNSKSHNSVVRIPNLLVGLFEFSNLGKLLSINKGHRYFYYEDININKVKNDIVVDAVSGGYMLFNTLAFKKIGGFDERFFMYLEDVDICYQAKKLKMKTIYCPHSVIKHAGGASSNNKYKIHHQAWFDSRKAYFLKHFSLLQNMIIQPIYIIEEYFLKYLHNL